MCASIWRNFRKVTITKTGGKNSKHLSQLPLQPVKWKTNRRKKPQGAKKKSFSLVEKDKVERLLSRLMERDKKRKGQFGSGVRRERTTGATDIKGTKFSQQMDASEGINTLQTQTPARSVPRWLPHKQLRKSAKGIRSMICKMQRAEWLPEPGETREGCGNSLLCTCEVALYIKMPIAGPGTMA